MPGRVVWNLILLSFVLDLMGPGLIVVWHLSWLPDHVQYMSCPHKVLPQYPAI